MYTFMIKEGDVVVAPTGKLATITGQNKIKQDVEKIILTRRETSDVTRFDPNYGSDLARIAMFPTSDPSTRALEVRATVRQALVYLKQLQGKITAKLSDPTNFPDDEKLYGVEGFRVKVDEGDPRRIKFDMRIVTLKTINDTENMILVGGSIG